MASEITRVLLPRYTVLTSQESEGSRTFNNRQAVIDTALLLVQNVRFRACRDALARQKDCSSISVCLLCSCKNWRRSTMKSPALIFCTVISNTCHTDVLTWPSFSELRKVIFGVPFSLRELLYFHCYPSCPGLSHHRSFVRGKSVPPSTPGMKTLFWWMLNCR